MFKRLLRRFINWIQSDQCVPEMGYTHTQTIKSSNSIGNTGIPINERNNGLNFTVYSASGGKVIQVYSYDQKTDRVTSNLHIITDKENLGEELAMIITRETISR